MRSGEREKGGESYVMINVEKLYHSQGTMETRTRKRAMGECNWCGKAAGGGKLRSRAEGHLRDQSLT